jgi:hypothetical protein
MDLKPIRIHSSLIFCRQAGGKNVQLPSNNFKNLLVGDIPVVSHGSGQLFRSSENKKGQFL